MQDRESTGPKQPLSSSQGDSKKAKFGKGSVECPLIGCCGTFQFPMRTEKRSVFGLFETRVPSGYLCHSPGKSTHAIKFGKPSISIRAI